MRLYTESITNHTYCMINNAVFTDEKGKEYCIDRSITEYTIEGNRLFMEWKDLFIWNDQLETEEYIEDEKFFEHLSFGHFDLEEDAPDHNYAVELQNWYVE